MRNGWSLKLPVDIVRRFQFSPVHLLANIPEPGDFSLVWSFRYWTRYWIACVFPAITSQVINSSA